VIDEAVGFDGDESLLVASVGLLVLWASPPWAWRPAAAGAPPHAGAAAVMTDIASFCASLKLDEPAVRRVLESESSAAGRQAPWYVLLLLGLGAWITALIMIIFVAVLLNVAFDVDEPGLGSAVIGAAMFLGGLLIEAKTKESVFAEQFAIALVAAGAAIAAASLGFEFDSLWSAAIAAAVLTAIDIWHGRHVQQQFLLAALAVGLGIAALSDALASPRIDIVAFAAPIGALLYLRPPPRDMRPTATVLLLAIPFYALVNDSLYTPLYGYGNWVARIVAMATILGWRCAAARPHQVCAPPVAWRRRRGRDLPSAAARRIGGAGDPDAGIRARTTGRSRSSACCSRSISCRTSTTISSCRCSPSPGS
jgi:hypothetical protein